MKKIINFFEKYKDIIYIICLNIFLIATLLFKKTNIFANYETILKILRYLVLIPVAAKIILLDIKNYTKKNWITIAILVIVTLIIRIFTKNARVIMQYIVLILGCYNIDFRKIIKSVIISEATTILIIVALALIGVIPNYGYLRSSTNTMRYSLGFAFPSFIAIFTYSLTCMYVYYKAKKINIYEYIILILINIAIFIVTNTKFELISALLIIGLSILHKYYKKENINKIVVNIAKYIMPILVIISILLSITYNWQNQLHFAANKLVSNRIYLMSKAVKANGLPPFGKEIEWIDQNQIKNGEKQGEKENVVDNGYINIILTYGWVFLIMLLYSHYRLVEIKEEKNDKFFKYILIVLAIHTFINPQLMQIVYNPFILLLGETILKKSEEKEIIEQ